MGSAAYEMLVSSAALFLDARDSKDFEVSHIPGALHLPGMTFNLPANILLMPAFQSAVTNCQKAIVVYSDTGTRMSRCVTVAHVLRNSSQIDPERVVRMKGGLNDWKRCAFPVEGDKRRFFAGQALGANSR